MALSEVILTITDGALGIVPEAIDGISAKVGCCSTGTVATLYSFSSITDLKATLGVGPLVEAAAHLLSISGGPVYCVPVTHTSEGAAGAITKNGSGPTITVAGAARDEYNVKVVIVAGGALGVGTFKWCADSTAPFPAYSAVTVCPSGGTFALGDTGLTLTFPSGTYVAEETYTFVCTPPVFNTTNLNTALTALMADAREWRFLHVVGVGADAPATAAIAAVVDTALATAANNYRYVRAIVDGADDADADYITAFASTSSTRVAVVVGYCDLVSSISGRVYKRNAGWPVAARAAKAPVHEDLGRVKSGSLPGVTKLYRDERATPGLDSQRFTTLRTFIGLAGCYITAGRTLATNTSDYQLIQNGFVIDKACRIIRTALLKYLNDDIRVDAITGYILEADALAIEDDVLSQLNTGLSVGSPTGNASAATVKVNRTNNILSSMTLQTQERIVPKGYARQITADIGLFNPALQPV